MAQTLLLVSNYYWNPISDTGKIIGQVKCIFLDVPRPEKGEYLFRKIVMQLDLVEEDYFGLQFMDKNQVPHWLDKKKKIKKQIQGMLLKMTQKNFAISFRAQFQSKN